MKNVILFIAVVILFGCKGKEKVSQPVYPKFVKNKCTNQWAVLTGINKGNGEYVYLGSHDKTDKIVESRMDLESRMYAWRTFRFGPEPADYAINNAYLGAEYNVCKR